MGHIQWDSIWRTPHKLEKSTGRMLHMLDLDLLISCKVSNVCNNIETLKNSSALKFTFDLVHLLPSLLSAGH